ncbi:MAG: DinB family protein [Chitinophagaceae bacterium]|nr:DinB family protein [Chitinophagaceae bacterium]
MRATIEHLEKIVSNYTRRLEAIPEEEYIKKPRPEKWSKKEILGHLIDSAQNNIRRFVVAQYEDIPRIGYDQDKWVALADYQHYPTDDLIKLWKLLNLHICRVLTGISPEMALRKCAMGNMQQYTIEWLAADYCNHLLHHLHQILELEPIAYP